MSSGKGSFLRVGDVAEALGVSKARVYTLLRRGELPVVRWGPRGTRVPLSALLEWAAQQALKGAATQHETR